MAIPISEYIDIKSNIIQATVGLRDFSGLVFSADAMKSGLTGTYAQYKTDYDAGKAVLVTRDLYSELFDATTTAYQFATKYFSYSGGNKTVSILYVAKMLDDESAVTAYNRVTAATPNFGSFTFLGEREDLAAVVSANESADYLMVISLKNGTTTNAYNGTANVHVVVDGDSDDATPNLAAYMPMAWYASVDYSSDNAASSIDYKLFGSEPAAVTTLASKTVLDGVRINYVGLAQTNGQNFKFYQTGVNCDGTDTGVYRDKIWIEGEVKAGWLNLASSVTKIPANDEGADTVKLMIIGVATRGIQNGSILLDKPLTDNQRALVRNYTGVEDADSTIETQGYYITTEVVAVDNKYVCKYVLVYAKGDHIAKVTGSHYLV